ncbi:hypothetical protein ATCC90586_009921 [Pythium insidiosum]|nr:hypothetical protein ATCC90586_009921 [Pythium insidiosum]
MAPSIPVSSLLLGGDLRQESLEDDYIELNPSQQPPTWFPARPTLRGLSKKSLSTRLLDAKAALLAKKPSIAQLRASLPSVRPLPSAIGRRASETARQTADFVRSSTSTRLSHLVPSRRLSFARLRKRQHRHQEQDNQYEELDDERASLTSSEEDELDAHEYCDVYEHEGGFYVEAHDTPNQETS